MDLSDRPGWEYDDVWMFSDGNILFTGMQYVAGITPDKKVVWRYDCNNSPQLVEINPNKKVVWVLQDWQDLGDATAVQIVDDPGILEISSESEH